MMKKRKDDPRFQALYSLVVVGVVAFVSFSFLFNAIMTTSIGDVSGVVALQNRALSLVSEESYSVFIVVLLFVFVWMLLLVAWLFSLIYHDHA